MSVTVSGANYELINACEAFGDWTELVPEDVTDFFKQGTQCIGFELWSSGDNDTYITGTWDLDGVKHLRFWMMTTVLKELNTDALGGVQVYVSDGANTGYYYISGSTTYPGGWFNPVIDLLRDVDSGTKPDMTAITTIGLRFNLTASAKKTQSCWIDHLSICDGLTVYGDDAGGYFDFEDIYVGDNATTLGIGIVRKIGGQYFSTGSIQFNDDSLTAGCKFQAKSQVLIFEDRKVNADLYSFDVTDNGTGTTEFILGDKVGTAGIQGCLIRVEDESQLAKFDIDGFTDTNVDNFKLYGSTFFGADAITFAAAAATVEVLGTAFEACGQVDPKSANTDDCFFINTASLSGAIIWNESINIAGCSFIGNVTGAAIEMPSDVGTPYAYNTLLFSGNTYDVFNSSGNAITVNLNDSDATSYSPSGSLVTFVNTKSFKFTLNPSITGYEWRVYEITALGSLVGAVEKDGEESAAADNQTYSYSYTGDQPIAIQIIGHANDYEESITYYTLGNANQDITINLTRDDNN